jgi:uncharacterized membrane protein YhhN
MSYILLWIALIVAFIDWIAIARKWRRVEYIAKPAVIIILLIWLVINDGFSSWTIWFGIGLVFSLFGDIFLLLPEKYFKAGLFSFLLTHIAYTIGLNPTLPQTNIAGLILAALVGITAAQIYNRVAAGAINKGQPELRIPFLLYTVVISLMLLSALLTLVRPAWDALSAITVSIGALLFFISDSLIGWDKFIRSIPNGRSYIMITYHLGQFGIIIGSTLHYLS